MNLSSIGYPCIEFDVVCEQAVAIGGGDIKRSEAAENFGSTPLVTTSPL